VGWWLMWVATSVVQGVPRVMLLLQSWVVEKVVVKDITTGFMGVRS